jgi:hypothetical protein
LLAVKVAVCPTQMVGEFTVGVIEAPIVIVATAVLEHPSEVPVTV